MKVRMKKRKQNLFAAIGTCLTKALILATEEKIYKSRDLCINAVMLKR